ncbi:VanZ family protein [Eudoraea chungangensis]|uniref:VanZ family protein n=1 Tax=Eudoraea chungangensis TaxID=1481905 RepID=UPI003B978E7F
MFLITVLSLFSFREMDNSNLNLPNLDKAVHFCFYFVASFLCFLSYLSRKTYNSLKGDRNILYISICLVFYGILIEIIQYKFIPHRSGEMFDVLANSLGVIFGTAFAILIFYRKSQLK